MQIERYQGTPDQPFPPTPQGWREIDVPYHDEPRRARASGLLGALPPWSYIDEPAAGGVTRYFSYEHPHGRGVGALWLEREPATLGQSNPNFVAPTAAQVAASPPGDALASAAVSLLSYFSSSGVPNEHVSDQQVLAFQTTWNADALSGLNGGNSSLSEDGDYGPNTHDALASISGGTAPAVNPAPAPSPSPSPSPGGGGQTTTEPVPAPDATCTQWVADASNAAAITMANNISYQDTPTKWTDQGTYDTTIGGVRYRFVMWYENGLKAVAAFRCAAGPSAPAQASTTSSSSSGGTVAAIVAGVVVVGGIIATAVAAKHPIHF